MYVSIGSGAVVRRGDIVGVFDVENVTWAHRTRKSLAVCEKQGRVVSVGEDLPRSLVICSGRKDGHDRRHKKWEHAPSDVVYMTQLSVATLERRIESEQI